MVRFQELVWGYYREHRRPMAWRDNPSPYNVVISEVMLQQTQVARVLEKFPIFLSQFPNFQQLAGAKQDDVLRAWQGMGYNRRALFLHRLAQAITSTYGGVLPSNPAELVKLPGIGPGTAGSIAAFAYDQPVIFIETNIRRVFIHHFFAGQQKVSDRELMPLIAQALDPSHSREWYYALMDYGAYLAIQLPNPNRRSRHYTRQSKFEGSDRQLRGAILRLYLAGKSVNIMSLRGQFPAEPRQRIERILAQLKTEGLIHA